MNKSQLLSTLFALLLLFSCSSESKIRVLSEDFPETINITGEVLNIPSDSLDDCLDLKIVDDFLMIFGQTGSKFITAVDLSSMEIQRFISKGRGPNEFIFPELCLMDSTLYLMQYNSNHNYDCVLFSVNSDTLALNIQKFVSHNNLFALPKVILSNRKVIYPHSAYSSYEASPMRFMAFNEFNDSISSFGNVVGVFNNVELPSLYPNLGKNDGYCAKIFGEDKFAFASYLGDYVEFYDCTSLDNPSMKRFLYNYSDLIIKEIEGGVMAEVSPDCVYGFSSICASMNNYFLLHVGVKYDIIEKSDDILSNNVYVFSSNGEPVIHLLLNRRVRHIAVTPNGKYLYAWSPNPQTLEPEIVRYTLP